MVGQATKALFSHEADEWTSRNPRPLPFVDTIEFDGPPPERYIECPTTGEMLMRTGGGSRFPPSTFTEDAAAVYFQQHIGQYVPTDQELEEKTCEPHETYANRRELALDITTPMSRGHDYWLLVMSGNDVAQCGHDYV